MEFYGRGLCPAVAISRGHQQTYDDESWKYCLHCVCFQPSSEAKPCPQRFPLVHITVLSNGDHCMARFFLALNVTGGTPKEPARAFQKLSKGGRSETARCCSLLS